MDNLKIKKAGLGDLDSVKEIEVECGLSGWSKEDYLKEITRDNDLFLVVKNSEKVIGFILARLIMYELSHSKEFEIEIYNLAVKKEFRRGKIATSLIETLIKTGRNLSVSKVYLEVRESNTGGIHFYHRNLFRVTGKRRNFYSNPSENAILMCLDLTEEKNT